MALISIHLFVRWLKNFKNSQNGQLGGQNSIVGHNAEALSALSSDMRLHTTVIDCRTKGLPDWHHRAGFSHLKEDPLLCSHDQCSGTLFSQAIMKLYSKLH